MALPIKKEKLQIFADIFRTLHWALKTLENFKWKLYIYIFCLIFQSLYAIVLTSQIGNLVDLALEDNVQTLAFKGVLFFVLYVINIIISLVCGRIAAKNFNGMYNDLELLAYRKIMDSSWQDLTDYHSGDLITRLSSDIKVVALNTSGLVPSMISKLTLISCAGLYIIFLDYSMILVVIAVAPIMLITSRIFMGKIYRSHKEIKEIESRITSYNKETFNNIQAVKAFGIGNLFYDRMIELENTRKKADLRSNKYSLCSWAISFFAGILAAGICISWMFYRVHTGVISFGSLSVLGFLAFQIGMSLKELLKMIPDIMEYMASYSRVKMLLFLPDEVEEIDSDLIENFSEKAENGVSVLIEDMYFMYKNGYSVFEGATLEANPGEIIALVGPSGEGKTTMLRIILGIVTALKGKVLALNGIQSLKLGKQTRSLISYVPQGNTMMAGSILENMRLVKQDASDEEIKEALETACIYDFIERLPDGLNHMLGESGLGFSEGQNQRLSIARALLKDAPILLLDEATSALDVATERKVLNNIMIKDPKKTVILTTHRPTVLTMCDRVYRLANKKVEVIGENDIQKLMDEF
ncbi:ABC transporter ATP-binding protein [Butyrivibrio sp. INlla16]|uniref:ABC transporter ATP-binding protein n=1 Tax=Butyrivibrio sp. INlla16 TaxID=1520807 RepID=UPI0008906BD0|nr:ABC transporter ATP-binding protein [Butyrivibrio sp. INlla16]SDB68558.1 ABC-type multidrug transport system, ATPase and permease component [Butyrivibrio sp. INlla16]